MLSPEVGYDLAPEELDRLLHLGHGVGDEEQARQRRDAGLLVDPDALADLRRAADEIALLEAARLLAQRRAFQRFEMLVELRAVEALDGVVMRAADRARELRRDVDGAAVASGLVRRAADVLHPARDLLGRQHRRHPAFTVLAGAAPHLEVVA